jgi:cobalt-zinc-cadmium efflux system protein
VTGHVEGEDSHHHSHGGSGHAHHHLPATFGRAFAIGITLNIVYVVTQVLFGLAAHSLALLADAGHNLGDVMGLFLAWGAGMLAKRQPTPRYTYGLRRSTILASLANAILLLVAVGGITWEAIRRFGQSEQVAGITVIWVAALGVVVNGVTAMLFASGRKSDLNIKGAFLHMAADAAVSAGVVVAGFAILLSGWWWLDPVVSLLINAVIVWGTWGLLRNREMGTGRM